MIIKETKTCQDCKETFMIDASDFAFYEKMRVPPPTFCPQCRLQRRLAWRNEVGFHKRKCDLCGKEIIATYPREATFPVYCRECWWSDKWDGKQYGQDYDWDKPFFQQFFELQSRVPAIALQVTNSINCEFTNQIVDCKNCYFLISAGGVEDSYYGYRILDSRNVVDSALLLRCENCYKCIECLGVSCGIYIQNCADSLNLSFCYDVRGSHDCFMSSNLRGASYIFRNKQFLKVEYERAMKNIDFSSHKNILKFVEEFKELERMSIHAYADMKNTINTTGHIVRNAKDCKNVFTSSDLENCSYILYVDGAKDCMDVNTGTLELGYEISTGGIKSADVKFSTDVWPEVREIQYCASCRNGSHNLFGCIGLKKETFCILNKQYSEGEYKMLIPKIIAQMDEVPYMDKKGRRYKYGEFFPAELSHSPYNESQAQDYFPLTKEEAESQGYRWLDKSDRSIQITMQSENLPDDVSNTADSILLEIIECAHGASCNHRCTVGFRIIPAELKFHKDRRIALPRLCPNCRNYERLVRQNPIRLWRRKCHCAGSKSEINIYANQVGHFHGANHCPNEFETSYAPDRPEIIYCEECYQSEII